MNGWRNSTKSTYKRWRNPAQWTDADFSAHTDEDQVTDNEICTIATGGDQYATSSDTNATEATFTINEALEVIGFGKFQWKMSLLTGLAWVADAMEMMILSILGPTLHCEWRIPAYQVALITSVVFIGMGISSPVWGKVSDKYGRKVGLVMCSSWTFFYGILSAFSPVYGWVLVLRGLVGVGIGGIAQSITLYTEFLPVKARSTGVMMLSAFWAAGAILEVLLALLVMPTLGWRWLLGLSAIPMALFICFYSWLPESPRFDVLSGRREKAIATLTRIAKENNKSLPQGRMVEYEQIERGKIKDLFNSRYWKTTVLLWFIWLSNTFTYFGIVLLTTELFRAEHSCWGGTHSDNIEPRCDFECKYLSAADYKDLLLTTFAELPGLLIIVLAVEKIGRKKTMALCFFMYSISLLPLFACIGRIALTIFISIARAFISAGFQVVFVYTPEVFPTENRALAMGISNGMARVGALVSPFVAQVLLRTSVYPTISLYCGCSLLAGIACLILPFETLGKNLQESHLDQEADGQTSSAADNSNGLWM
uniref:Synaptic vesicle 2-related protein-like n=1 Tax=Gouania willdenowi TaxID=441366 RepID=A0A8C5HH33_GOUWI